MAGPDAGAARLGRACQRTCGADFRLDTSHLITRDPARRPSRVPLPYHRGVLGGRHSRVVVCLVPALLFAALYLRALDYGYVWTDIAEFQAGTILRPPGQLLAAMVDPGGVVHHLCRVGHRSALHGCLFGVLDLRDQTVETPEQIAGRIRGALGHVPVERLVIAPDCGFKYLPRHVSFAKLSSMVEGRNLVRAELT